MPELGVTSEIYDEYDYKTNMTPAHPGNVISEFPFILPESLCTNKYDEDNDLDVERPQKQVIKIEHRPKTAIALVGLQVWRGAFLLSDLMIYLGLHEELKGKCILELGAGTGITSFVASLYAKRVVCTDIDIGGIIPLIQLNAKYNSKFIKSDFKILTLDFKDTAWNRDLEKEIKDSDILLAADVIYDDDVTAAFVATMQKMLNMRSPKILYLALEKRYVFTLEHLDSVAPCYETFLNLLDKVKNDNLHSKWKVEEMPLNFPKYFQYDRIKELVLWKITSIPTI
ncbi:Methyltransferase-like protein 22 [Eumeta japonica]|uniref:Methyltransferase-like protein 22 n=1 Tax=Eumeta variegata TaxID=151549 RepID=A0A4C1WTM9_EUMVA|nr:Methyltransferase-like protein 22 [Eumeta japonica]